MESALAENIRSLRKKQHLTQQQLADAMGVTVGAIHKWEQNLSVPDIRMIMDLAGFFRISVDALVGYQVPPREKSQILEELQTIRRQKTYAENWETLESWVRQYPNDFQIVSGCGCLYQLAGTETRDPRQLNRALELLSHAVNLSPSAVSTTELYEKMGFCCLDLNQKQRGLEILKAHNPCGIHNSTIGMELAEEPEHRKEAEAMLSQAMLQAILSLHHIASGYLTIYLRDKNYRQAEDLLDRILVFFKSLEIPGAVSFLKKDLAVFLALRACVLLETGDASQALAALREARQQALAYDAAPDPTSAHVDFCQGMEPVSTFDGDGARAMAAVTDTLRDQGGEIFDMWEVLIHEA